jgi:hypothetical protein
MERSEDLPETAISKTAFATSTAMRVSFDMMGSSYA